jgi:hypothetical protein
MVYPALLLLMRIPRLPIVDWTDAPADLNGLVRFAERRNWFLRVCHHISNAVYSWRRVGHLTKGEGKNGVQGRLWNLVKCKALGQFLLGVLRLIPRNVIALIELFLVNKTNRCTELQFYWYYDSPCFGQSFCPSSGVLSRTSALVRFMEFGDRWLPGAGCNCHQTEEIVPMPMYG